MTSAVRHLLPVLSRHRGGGDDGRFPPALPLLPPGCKGELQHGQQHHPLLRHQLGLSTVPAGTECAQTHRTLDTHTHHMKKHTYMHTHTHTHTHTHNTDMDKYANTHICITGAFFSLSDVYLINVAQGQQHESIFRN